MVEANGQGVVWGIGYDHTAWVYTGGGSCFQGEGGQLPGPSRPVPSPPIWLPHPTPEPLSRC